MYLESMRMFNGTTGWAVGEPRDHKDLMQETGERSIFRTTDGGSHWETIKTLGVSSGFTPFFLSGSTVWVATNRQLAHTGNAGTSWEFFNLPFTTDEAAGIHHLTFLDAHIGWFIAQIYLSSAPPKSAPFAALYRTDNGGMHWHQLFRVSGESALKCRVLEERRRKEMKSGETIRIVRDLAYRGTPAPQFTDMQCGWVGVPDLEMLTTSDGGEHWEELDLHPMPQGINQIQFINKRLGWGLLRSQEIFSTEVCQTTDGGKTWTRMIPTVSPS